MSEGRKSIKGKRGGSGGKRCTRELTTTTSNQQQRPGAEMMANYIADLHFPFLFLSLFNRIHTRTHT